MKIQRIEDIGLSNNRLSYRRKQPNWLALSSACRFGVSIALLLIWIMLGSDSAHGQQLGARLQAELAKPFYFNQDAGAINTLGAGGDGTSEEVGGSLLAHMNMDLGDAYFLSFGAGPGWNVGTFTSLPILIDRFNPNAAVNASSVLVNSLQHVQASVRYVSALSEIVIGREVMNDISISLGGWGKLPISTSTELHSIIDEPVDSRYPSGGNERELPSDAINTGLLAYGPMFGLRYTLLKNEPTGLSFDAGVRYNLASNDDLSTRISATAGISLKWNIESDEGTEEVAAPAIVEAENNRLPVIEFAQQESAPEESNLFVQFASIGSERSLKATQREKEIEQYTVFLPVALNEVEVKTQCTVSEGSVEEFHTEELPQLVPLYRNMLNVLAERLYRHPRSKARLSFQASDRSKYATLRQTVMEHLARTWGVEAERITAIPQPVEGYDQDQLIISGDARITAPIRTNWIERSYSLPPIIIEHNGHTHEKARLIVEQNGRVLQDTLAVSSPMVLSGFPVSMGSGTEFPMIFVRLEIIDSSGSKNVATDSLRIVLSSDMKEEIAIVRFASHSSAQAKERQALVTAAYATGSITDEEREVLLKDIAVEDRWYRTYPGLSPKSVDAAAYRVLRDVRIVEVERRVSLVPNADLQENGPSNSDE